MATGLVKIAVRFSGTRGFYAWVSDFLYPLARRANSYPLNEMERKDFKILNHSKILRPGKWRNASGKLAKKFT